MSTVINLHTVYADNYSLRSGYAEIHPISAEALGHAMHDMFIATAQVGRPVSANAASLSGAFFRNQDGGGYREMQPICETGYASAMTEMYVTAVRSRTANVGSGLKAEMV